MNNYSFSIENLTSTRQMSWIQSPGRNFLKSSDVSSCSSLDTGQFPAPASPWGTLGQVQALWTGLSVGSRSPQRMPHPTHTTEFSLESSANLPRALQIECGLG